MSSTTHFVKRPQGFSASSEPVWVPNTDVYTTDAGLVIKVELTKSRGKIGKARGVCSVNGEVVSEADVAFMLMDG